MTENNDGFGAFVADMAKAQLEMGAAQIDSKNPNFGSKYASLPSVAKVAKVINKYGFMISHETVQTATHVSVKTIISHVSGHSRSIQIDIPTHEYTTKDGKVKRIDAHMIGSAITYGRRYGLSAILGIPADEDDDGNALVAEVHHQAAETKQKPQSQTKSLQNQKQQTIPAPKYTKEAITKIYKDSHNPYKKDICTVLQKTYGEVLTNWPVPIIEGFVLRLSLTPEQVSRYKEFVAVLRNDSDVNLLPLSDAIRKQLEQSRVNVDANHIAEFMAYLSTQDQMIRRSVLDNLDENYKNFCSGDQPPLNSPSLLAAWAVNSHWIRIPPENMTQIVKTACSMVKGLEPALVDLVDAMIDVAVAKMSFDEMCETFALTMGYTTGIARNSVSNYILQIGGKKEIQSIRNHFLEALPLIVREVEDYSNNNKGRE